MEKSRCYISILFIILYSISGDTYTLDGYLDCMTYAYMCDLSILCAVLVLFTHEDSFVWVDAILDQ
jgi:hypothetical protein